MKKILTFIVVVAGLTALAPATFAQGVFYDKDISAPDPNGVYTLSLEAYVTGSKVTTETLTPMDIVLCLAYNNSMYHDAAQISALRRAVASFINTIKEKDVIKDEEGNPTGEHVGYRVALDFYGVKLSDYGNSAGLPGDTYYNLLDIQQFTATQSGSDGQLYRDGYSADLFPRSSNSFTGNEKSDTGMERAYQILQDAEDLKDNSVVVFFTNGTPGSQSGSGWNGGKDNSIAQSCINDAYAIKQSGSSIVSVGLYSTNQPDNMTSWLYLTSSDNVDGNGNPSSYGTNGAFPVSPAIDVTGVNSMLASTNTLEAIFTSIAQSIGGDYNIGSASSVLVDIVTTSFTVSTDADLGLAKVYKVRCVDDRPDIIGEHNFSTERIQLNTVDTPEELDAIENPTVRENTVCLVTDPVTGEVLVTGFDYGANWCGYITDETHPENSGPHGYKIVLEIPITANPDAVGGPNVLTNAEGSGLILKDDEGNVLNTYTFTSKAVSLPVNIHIEKTGLRKGESAKFMIERAYMPASGLGEDVPEEDWKYVSTVFVTKTSDEDPVVKVRGLPANGDVPVLDEDGEPVTERHDFVYRVREESWSWSYNPKTGPKYTDTMHVDNPFTFDNEKKDGIDYKVRHAESKATNVFKPDVVENNVRYNDSKKNTGTGR